LRQKPFCVKLLNCGTAIYWRINEQTGESIMAIDPQDVLVVTTENVPGYKTRKVIGEVFGVTSRSRNVVSNFGAGLKTLVGGEIGAFTNLLHETRLEAIGRLRVEAASRGANAVVMMRFDNESIAQTVGGTVAYGTAVLLEPEVQ
jgi:uncharacterized protein YbjQ (UPF0145 family)